MTPTQIELARHALGLTNGRMVSYRNRYVIGAGAAEHGDWLAMVEFGFATRRDGAKLPYGGDDLFNLTEAGTQAALLVGETLCGEDFPPYEIKK